jgi:alkaline phosphatase D
MRSLTRREWLAAAAACGASLAFKTQRGNARQASRTERRDLYPEGVASGDPHPDSVLLWTRRPPSAGSQASRLTVEVSDDPSVTRVVARATAKLSADADWTCRVLAAGLSPHRVYWYRFTDDHGFGSRLGRTVTAPLPNDDVPVRFTFVSCQNIAQGACNAYRRMIWEDEKASPAQQLGFVLHLGDFVYEIAWYPEDRPQGYYGRRIRDIARYPHGEKHADFHIPTTVDDYRLLYQGYLHDPDLQDARARWPFICVWDNHEFSWKGWQSQQEFGQGSLPAQTRKAAANQAWWEYQPARVIKPGDPSLDRFRVPNVKDAPIAKRDEHGLGLEPGNLAAIQSLEIFRAFRFGRNAELIVTDNRSFRSQQLADSPDTAPFKPTGIPYFIAQDVTEILDAGRAYRGGPPDTIAFAGRAIPNPRKNASPQSMLGARQKAWFMDRLRKSTSRWKIWGNSVAMLDWRTDPQNLPPDLGSKWPTTGYGLLGDDDWSGYITERNEILGVVRNERITGFASVAGDRHSFLAGAVSPTLPPHPYEPVGVEFVTGSISAPTICEGAEYNIPKDHPLRALYLSPRSLGGRPEPALNLTIMHGVRASLALGRTSDPAQALAARNPDVAPQMSFADLGGHGYAAVTASRDALEVEFVCIPRPIERSDREDGGPLLYRVVHRVAHWNVGQPPRLERRVVEGTPPVGSVGA